jgi:RNA polymerase sigma-70 factor (sigma-E family)
MLTENQQLSQLSTGFSERLVGGWDPLQRIVCTAENQLSRRAQRFVCSWTATVAEPGGLLLGVDRDQEFHDFVIANGPGLLRAAFLLTGDRGHAEDLAQQTLMRSYLAWDRVAAADDPSAYTKRILYRTFGRIHRRRTVPETLTAPVDVGQRDQADETGDRDQLRRALRELTPRQRAVVVLRFFDDLSVESTARILGCSVGTVKSQTAKALSRLRLSSQLDVHEGKVHEHD